MGKNADKPATADHMYYIIGSYMTVTFILSLSCNIFVTFIFCRLFRKKPNTVNFIIINLGIANLLQSCPSSLWTIMNSFKRSYMLGHSMCLIDGVWVGWCAITVITLLAYLGYERYQMIKQMRTAETRIDVKNIYTVGSCWLYGLFWSIMPLVGWANYGIEGIGISCTVEWRSSASYVVCLFLAANVVPISVIGLTYYRTWRIAKQSAVRVIPANDDPQSVKKASHTHKKVAVMGALMAGSFFLTWTPYAIVSFTSFINPTAVSRLEATIPAIIAKSSAVYFPLICSAKHSGFKAECRRALGRFAAAAGRKQITIITTTRGNQTNQSTVKSEMTSNQSETLNASRVY